MDEMNAENEKAHRSNGKKLNKKLVLVAAILAILLVLALHFGITAWSENQIVSIKAVYAGATEAGTILDSTNTGIQVIGRTRKRSSVEIPFGEWKVDTAQVLSPDVTSTVSIQYKRKTCELRVACTDSQVASISAYYDGIKEDGTVISNTTEGFSATASLRDGREIDITDQCVIDNGSISLKENKTSTLQISYTDPLNNKTFSTSLEITCSTRTVRQIVATYVGPAYEGEILDSNNQNFIVSATYNSGISELVQGWEIYDPATVKLGKSATVTIYYGGKETKVVVECNDDDLTAYRKNCKKLNYSNLVRYPEKYMGTMIQFRGKITQVYDSSSATSQRSYRIRVGSQKYVDVVFEGTLKKGNLIDGDSVTCYGTFMGIDHNDNGYPIVSAKIIDR